METHLKLTETQTVINLYKYLGILSLFSSRYSWIKVSIKRHCQGSRVSFPSLCLCILLSMYVYVVVWLQSCVSLPPARLLCPGDFPGKNTGVCCHFLLQGIFLAQEWNLSLLQEDSLLLTTKEAICECRHVYSIVNVFIMLPMLFKQISK